MSQHDPLQALLDALRAVGDNPDHAARVVASFRQAHVVMTVDGYNDELAATYMWQQDMKARIARYDALYGGLPEPVEFEHVADYPLEYTTADDTDQF